MCHDYLQEITGSICNDFLRLELLHETTEMRKRAYLLPRDSMVHKLPISKNGEHQYASYREEQVEDAPKIQFFNCDSKKIQNYWAVPSYAEILSLENPLKEFKATNFQDLYVFKLGDEHGDDMDNKPEFYYNN